MSYNSILLRQRLALGLKSDKRNMANVEAEKIINKMRIKTCRHENLRYSL
jgi:hypothetical protein